LRVNAHVHRRRKNSRRFEYPTRDPVRARFVLFRYRSKRFDTRRRSSQVHVLAKWCKTVAFCFATSVLFVNKTNGFHGAAITKKNRALRTLCGQCIRVYIFHNRPGRAYVRTVYYYNWICVQYNQKPLFVFFSFLLLSVFYKCAQKVSRFLFSFAIKYFIQTIRTRRKLARAYVDKVCAHVLICPSSNPRHVLT